MLQKVKVRVGQGACKLLICSSSSSNYNNNNIERDQKNNTFVPMFHDLENKGGRGVGENFGAYRIYINFLRWASPFPCQTPFIILEHWNIGTKRLNSLIRKAKSCSKHFLILEQTLQTPWNKIFQKKFDRPNFFM